MNLRSHARKLLGRDQLSEHTVKASKVEHLMLDDVRKRSTLLDDELSNLPRLPNGDVLDGRVWERLAEDVWSEFYGLDEPALRARDKIDPRYHVNRGLADKQARDAAFQETRAMTRGRVAESALGLRGALHSLRESYADELADHAERQNEIADSEDALDQIDEMLAKLRQQRDSEPTDLGEIDAKIRDLAARKRAAVSSLQEAVARQQQHAGDLLDATKKAVAKAAESAQEAVQAVSMLPGKEPGVEQQLSPDVALAFADRINANPVLARVLDMLGRLELSMGTTRRQLRRGGYEEMVDIETGNDLQVVLPSEKALLTHPIGRLDFYRRYHERSLMQYEMWSEEELKKGPIIIAADGSDSMRGAPNEFCRGLTLACCNIAHREHRNAAALEFGSTGQLREFWFPAERRFDIGMALDFAEHFFAGGTDINQTLARAKELIDNEAPFHSADLIIVTDGKDRLTEQTYELRDALRAMGVKIHGLMVAAAPSQYLVEVCDAVTSVLDFDGPNSTSDRLAIDLT